MKILDGENVRVKHNKIAAIYKKYGALPAPVKASFWFLICSFTQKAISMITMPIFTRVLSSADFGQYSIYNSWLSIITVFATFNLSWGVFNQGLVKYEDDRKKYISSMHGLSSVMIAGAFLVYLIFHRFINAFTGLNTRLMLLMFLSIWSTTVFEFWAASQKVNYKYRMLVCLTILASISNPALGLFFIWIQDDGVFGRVLGITVTSMVLYGWLFFRQMYQGRCFYAHRYWVKSLKTGVMLIPHYLSQIVLSSADRIMIGQMAGQAAAGIYSVAYSGASVMTMFNNALSQTLDPWLYRKIRDNKLSEIGSVAYFSLVVVAVMNLLLISFAPEVLWILAPSEYGDAIWVVPPVSMSILFMFAYDLFAKFEFYYEKTRLISLTTMAGALLNLILNFVFIKIFGYYAAGYTTLLCYMIYAVLHYLSMRKICNEYCNGVQPYKTSVLLIIAAASLSFGFGMMMLYKLPLIRYTVVGLGCVVCLFNWRKLKNCMNTFNNNIKA